MSHDLSHPSWVCGLKRSVQESARPVRVTPFVGVWIETRLNVLITENGLVTPFVGVWIETAPGVNCRVST